MSVAAQPTPAHPLTVPPSPTKPRSIRQGRRDAVAKHRRDVIEARAHLMAALASGESHGDIADRFGIDVATLRRRVREELAARPPLPARDHVSVQIMRLEGALRAFAQALARGDWRAAEALPKVVQALDRYHGLAEAAGRAAAQMRRLGALGQAAALAPPPARLPFAGAAEGEPS